MTLSRYLRKSDALRVEKKNDGCYGHHHYPYPYPYPHYHYPSWTRTIVWKAPTQPNLGWYYSRPLYHEVNKVVQSYGMVMGHHHHHHVAKTSKSDTSEHIKEEHPALMWWI